MKNYINIAVAEALAVRIKGNFEEFNAEGFIQEISLKLDNLELFQRLDLIRDTLNNYLPQDFTTACDILVRSLGPELPNNKNDLDNVDLSSSNGFIVVASTNYVAKYGIDYFDTSMAALYEMTKRFSSEGAIRFFIQKYPNKCFELFREWVKDENVHIRRLVSEGLRPRLPWAIRLQEFVKDPTPIVEFLDLLKSDKYLYVRRSVANNLNDISKDHPQIVITLLKGWKEKSSKEMDWLIKHALRTLVKQGNLDALEILGYEREPKLLIKDFTFSKEVTIGNNLEFSFNIESQSPKGQNLVVDYIIHHKKNNGTLTPKVFKIKNLLLKAGNSVKISKNHGIKSITTRKYYPGKHIVEIQINGKRYNSGEFNLHF